MWSKARRSSSPCNRYWRPCKGALTSQSSRVSCGRLKSRLPSDMLPSRRLAISAGRGGRKVGTLPTKSAWLADAAVTVESVLHLKAAEVRSWLLPTLTPSASCPAPADPAAHFPAKIKNKEKNIQTAALSEGMLQEILPGRSHRPLELFPTVMDSPLQ